MCEPILLLSHKSTRRALIFRLYCGAYTPTQCVALVVCAPPRTHVGHYSVYLCRAMLGPVLQARPPPGATSNHMTDLSFEPKLSAPEASQHTAMPPTWVVLWYVETLLEPRTRFRSPHQSCDYIGMSSGGGQACKIGPTMSLGKRG